MAEQTININVSVRVKLEELGRQIIIDGYRNPLNLRDHEYPVKYLDGVHPGWRDGAEIRMPLWELMRIFGPHCRMGVHPFFVRNEITLELDS